jgi:hypothetical protein
MAPPIPGIRRPPARRGRSAGDVLAGILAIIALLVLTAGVPLALLRLFGSPIPHTLPSLSAVTHQLDAKAILKVLAVVVWLAWLQLIVCVIAEVRAAVRNAGMPARVPLAGGTQAVVHRLVTAAVLLFTAAAALSPAFAHQAPPRAPHTISAVASQATGAGTSRAGLSGPAASAAAAERRAAVEKIYVVRPPVGRYHQSLWEIAQDHLGDGRRYPEIFAMNRDRIQPDGSKLTIASLIRPGWVLHMPRDAHGAGIEIVSRGADGQAAEAGHRAAGQETAGHGAAGRGGSGHGTAGQLAAGHSGAGQQTAAAAAGQAGGASHRHMGGAAPSAAPSAGGMSSYPTDLAVASLLAAGLLAALGRRRREQLWQRGFGRRVVAPAGAAGAAEAALRLGASEQSARLLDAGLRYLSGALSGTGAALPNVFAAHLSDGQLDLSIAPADQNPPAPWSAVRGGQVWRLPFAALPGLGSGEAGGALAPFPGLVSIGTDATGRVLVDLEAAQGLIAVTGPQPMVQAALAAIAVELATNRWSDQMQVIIVGFGEELAMIAPDRVTTAATLADVLPGLEARAAAAETALTESGVGSVLTGRSRGIQPDACAPYYLIMATPPEPQERDALLALARTRHRAAAGYVVAGDITGATWTWEVSEDGRLRAGVLGFDVSAQLLPAQQYSAVIELFRTAAEPARAASRAFAVDAAPAEQLVPGARMAVQISLLGPVSVSAPGVIEPDRVALATELAVYLAAHPGGVHLNVLTGALWPRGVTAEVRDAALARAAAWLGDDAAGRPNLITDAEGRLRLGPSVRVDWHVFRALVAHAAQEASRGGQAEIDYLRRALAEVVGPLLDGRGPGRYAWLATDSLEYEAPALVADAAHRLSGLLRAAGDARGAMEAARAGLSLAAGDELLRRDLLLGADVTGDEQLLAAVVAEVCERTALDEVLPRMAPETESLIDEILPSWRTSVA